MINENKQTRIGGGRVWRVAAITTIAALAATTAIFFAATTDAEARLAEAQTSQSHAFERKEKAERQVTFNQQTFNDWDETYSACGPRFGYFSETCESFNYFATEARKEFRAAQGRATNAASELAEATKLYDAATIDLEESRVRQWLLLALTLATSVAVALYVVLKARTQRAVQPAASER